MEETLPRCVRFGPFSLDLKAGELRTGNSAVLLQEQPLHVLRILIENEGTLVSREEIRKRLWPNDTIVEFEHSINAAINKLRKALGDPVAEPQYIQTVARRGYRLMVPVEWVTPAGDESSTSEVSSSDHGAAVRTRSEPGALTGRTVSHYRVLDIIGGGGMGVVYRAEDLKLGRRVALKFLPEELGNDSPALQRFEREARIASSLNHHNICAIYEFGEHEGLPFLVMESLEGETLRDCLPRAGEKGLPIAELLDLSIQVTDGLQAAHEKGIIHRDIKPANIFLTSKGVCKILDFGLAKLLEEGEPEKTAAQAANASRPMDSTFNAPIAEAYVGPAVKDIGGFTAATVKSDNGSIVSRLTRTGLAIGTAGYMSPEQVNREKLDARTDLFSFGLVLYEMATGQRAFGGKTAAAVHDAILHQVPRPVRDLNSTLAPGLEAIINKSLEKDRDLRYQSAAELRADLEKEQRGRQIIVPRLQGSGRWKAGSALVLLGLASFAYFWLRPAPAPKVSNYVQLTHDGQQKSLIGTEGSRLYLWLTSRDYQGMAEMSSSGGEPRRMSILPSANMIPLALSPDGTELLVVDGHGTPPTGPLWSVPMLGGSPRRLGDIEAYGAAWSPDGKAVAYFYDSHLFVAKADGTESRKLLTVNGADFAWGGLVAIAAWSPGGAHLRFGAAEEPGGVSFLWEVSIDGTGLHRLLPGWNSPPNRECCGKWTADGKYFLFLSRGQIWALPRKAGVLRSDPKPIQLTFSPMALSPPIPSTDGKKLFVVVRTDRGELTRYDLKSGRFEPFLGGISAEYVSFSKDGQWVAYVSYPEGTLWRSRADGSERLQLTYPPSQVLNPAGPRTARLSCSSTWMSTSLPKSTRFQQRGEARGH